MVDRDDRTIDIFENDPAGWVALTQLDDQKPTASVPVASYGTVELSLTAILT